MVDFVVIFFTGVAGGVFGVTGTGGCKFGKSGVSFTGSFMLV